MPEEMKRDGTIANRLRSRKANNASKMSQLRHTWSILGFLNTYYEQERKKRRRKKIGRVMR